jgi:hypothetical protein
VAQGFETRRSFLAYHFRSTRPVPNNSSEADSGIGATVGADTMGGRNSGVRIPGTQSTPVLNTSETSPMSSRMSLVALM